MCIACAQATEDAAQAKAEAISWVDALQKLSAHPIQSPEDGHAVVATVLQNMESLQEQQQHAFDDLASKDDELNNAESKLGTYVACRSALTM